MIIFYWNVTKLISFRGKLVIQILNITMYTKYADVLDTNVRSQNDLLMFCRNLTPLTYICTNIWKSDQVTSRSVAIMCRIHKQYYQE